jgi:hypothetical protein
MSKKALWGGSISVLALVAAQASFAEEIVINEDVTAGISAPSAPLGDGEVLDITVNGSITVVEDESVGIDIDVITDNQTTVTNNGSISVGGDAADKAFGVNLKSAGETSFTNAGTISAEARLSAEGFRVDTRNNPFEDLSYADTADSSITAIATGGDGFEPYPGGTNRVQAVGVRADNFYADAVNGDITAIAHTDVADIDSNVFGIFATDEVAIDQLNGNIVAEASNTNGGSVFAAGIETWDEDIIISEIAEDASIVVKASGGSAADGDTASAYGIYTHGADDDAGNVDVTNLGMISAVAEGEQSSAFGIGVRDGALDLVSSGVISAVADDKTQAWAILQSASDKVSNVELLGGSQTFGQVRLDGEGSDLGIAEGALVQAEGDGVNEVVAVSVNGNVVNAGTIVGTNGAIALDLRDKASATNTGIIRSDDGVALRMASGSTLTLGGNGALIGEIETVAGASVVIDDLNPALSGSYDFGDADVSFADGSVDGPGSNVVGGNGGVARGTVVLSAGSLYSMDNASVNVSMSQAERTSRILASLGQLNGATGVWASGFGGTSSYTASGQVSDVDGNTAGLAAGYRAVADNGFEWGVKAGYVHATGKAKVADITANEQDGNGGFIGADAAMNLGKTRLGFGLVAAQQSMDQSRFVSSGSSLMEAKSNENSTIIAPYASLALIDIAQFGGWSVSPSASLGYSEQKLKGYTETGAGDNNATVNSATFKMISAKAELAFGKSFGQDLISARVGYLGVQSTGGTSRDLTLAGVDTSIDGGKYKENSGYLSLGVVRPVSDVSRLEANVDALFGGVKGVGASLVFSTKF